MSNKPNPGPGRRFLDLDALAQYVQAMPILVKDVRSFHQRVDDGMTAHVERLNQVCHLTNWLKTNIEHMATQVANLQAELTLLQGMCATSSFQKEDWQLGLQEEGFVDEMTGAQDREMTTDPAETENEDDNQMGLQEMGFPHEVAHAQEEEGITSDPVKAQGINPGDEAAQGESDQEFGGKQEQLA